MLLGGRRIANLLSEVRRRRAAARDGPRRRPPGRFIRPRFVSKVNRAGAITLGVHARGRGRRGHAERALLRTFGLRSIQLIISGKL